MPLTMVGAGVAAQPGEPHAAPEGAASAPATEATAPTDAPTHALQDPASTTLTPVRRPAALAASVRLSEGVAALHDIPAAALAAYQRAAAVMAATAPACGLQWQLLAAIGRVESDHGRWAGSRLGSDGLARPAILGQRLDGRQQTSRIVDTDSGRYDRDLRFDRAVGPMQFIPSTWGAVGVDADGDGRRNPQDIDDAALAAGVYLCSGDEDLATEAGMRAAVWRYNHSRAYVDLVMALFEAYRTAVPVPADVAPPTYAVVEAVRARRVSTPIVPPGGDRAGEARSAQAQPAPPTTGTDQPPPPEPGPSESPSTQEPSDGPSGEPSGQPSDEPIDEPSDEPTGEPSGEPSEPEPTPSEPTAPPEECPPVPDTDGDGLADNEDPDSDGDGVTDDADADGVPDSEDTDVDGDGVVNEEDTDSDGDGLSNDEDPDADGDGVRDDCQAESTEPEPETTP